MADMGAAAALLSVDGFAVWQDGTLSIEEQGRRVECRLPRRTVRYLLELFQSATFRTLHPDPVGFSARGKDWILNIGYKTANDPMGMALGRKRPYFFSITAGEHEAVVKLPEASEGLQPGLVELAIEALARWDVSGQLAPGDAMEPDVTVQQKGARMAASEPLATGTVSADNGLRLRDDEKELAVPGIQGHPKLGTLSEERQLAVLRHAASLQTRPQTPAGRAFRVSAQAILARLAENETGSRSAERE